MEHLLNHDNLMPLPHACGCYIAPSTSHTPLLVRLRSCVQALSFTLRDVATQRHSRSASCWFSCKRFSVLRRYHYMLAFEPIYHFGSSLIVLRSLSAWRLGAFSWFGHRCFGSFSLITIIMDSLLGYRRYCFLFPVDTKILLYGA